MWRGEIRIRKITSRKYGSDLNADHQGQQRALEQYRDSDNLTVKLDLLESNNETEIKWRKRRELF